ncbi:MAG: hypothetical protein ACNA7Y_03940 [Gammaproteobacteria bacterium]
MIKKTLLLFSMWVALLVHPYALSATEISVYQMTDVDDRKRVQIKLSKTINELKEVHTKKIHLLIIDSLLEDYSHVHPRATSVPGLYEFDWSPKTNGHYRLWADLVPLDTNQQEYVIADLTPPAQKNINDRTISLKKIINGYTFQLSFEPKILRAGQPAMGMLTITDAEGKPVKNLEPLMGAFGHIVGFKEDFKTILHVHPMGEEPTDPCDRGGPTLRFHIEADKPGFIKLFAQVMIEGKEFFVPFGINFLSNRSKSL